MSDEQEFGVDHLFSAPFLSLVWKETGELNRALREIVLARRERFPSQKMSNAGGWQSKKDLQTWEGAAIRELLQKIDVGVYTMSCECFGEDEVDAMKDKWEVMAWANVNDPGDYNTLHNHAGGVWSGIYYVDTGWNGGETDEEHRLSGVISFRNPNLGPLAVDNLEPPEFIRRFFRKEHSIRPMAGQMCLFPSWLEHYVHPHAGGEPRISISWDTLFPGGS